MIHDVQIIPLKQIHDERGKIMHMLRSDDPHFTKFGEIYFSCVHPGVVKGWHIHKKMTLRYAVVAGKIKLVLYDDRATSPSKGQFMEINMSPENYALVIVPPLIWNGFKGAGDVSAIVANCADLAHEPQEIERLDPRDPRISYNWEIKHG